VAKCGEIWRNLADFCKMWQNLAKNGVTNQWATEISTYTYSYDHLTRVPWIRVPSVSKFYFLSPSNVYTSSESLPFLRVLL
jgi:hypothetical protein